MGSMNIADELLQISAQLRALKARNEELRDEMAACLHDTEHYDYAGYQFTRTPEKITQRINKDKLREAFSSAGLSAEIQTRIESEAFEDYLIEAGIRITKINS